MHASRVLAAQRRPSRFTGRRRLAPSVCISLLAHLLLLATIIIIARQPLEHPPEWVPPSMDMIFEGGAGNNPKMEVPAQRPPPRQTAPSAAAPSPPSVPAPAPAPVPVTPAPVPLVLPTPAPPRAGPPSAPPRSLSAPVRPIIPERPHAPVFPAPMMFSFGTPVERQPSPHHLNRGIDLSLGQGVVGPESATIFGRADSKEVGPDWYNRFEAWWERHAYYPPQAGENGEQGDVMLDLVIRRDGKVESVALAGRSGSQWLDMAALGVFRDARLPELPSDVAATVPLHLTIHYIIVRH